MTGLARARETVPKTPRNAPMKDQIARQSLPKDGKSLAHRSPKNTNRSAITNDVLASRANARTRHGRRIRDLFRGLLDELGPGPHAVSLEAVILELAELTAIYEDYRAALAGKVAKADEANALTRLSSTLGRVRRSLLTAAPAKPRANWLVQQHLDAAERVKQQRLLAMQQGPKHAQK
jgi:hypothetical protein